MLRFLVIISFTSCITATTLYSRPVHAEFVSVPESQLTMNSELSKDIYRTVSYLRHDHYLPKELNDENSKKIFDTYRST